MPQLDSVSEESHTTLRVEIDHRILLRVIPSYEFAGRGHPKVLDLPNDLFKELGIDKGALISLFHALAMLRGSFSARILRLFHL